MGHTFVAAWPILDQERPFKALVAEACRELDIMAQLAGAHLTGEPEWRIDPEGKLVCRVPARPADPDTDAFEEVATAARPNTTLSLEKAEQIRLLALRGFSIAAIARRVHVHWCTAKRYADPAREAA